MDCTPSTVPLVVLKHLDFHGILIMMSTPHISDGHGTGSMAVQVAFSQAVSDKMLGLFICICTAAVKC